MEVLLQYLDQGTAVAMLVAVMWAVKWNGKQHKVLCEEHKNDIKEHKDEYKNFANRCIDVIEKNTEANTRLSESIKHLEQKL